jgi:NAD(P)-dependent dehydrogenase (short-subunit alcohol dehydrogenase family)
MLALDGGSIVNIVDESAFAPVRSCVHHGVSKTSLWMLTRSCAIVLSPEILVNAVMPEAVLIPRVGMKSAGRDW